MIKLPNDFVETRVPGYYWSVTDQHLYSIKSGVLKYLVGPWKGDTRRGEFHGWSVSDLGKRKYMPLAYLETLKNEETTVIPVVRVPVPPVKKSYKRDVSKKYGSRKLHPDLFQ